MYFYLVPAIVLYLKFTYSQQNVFESNNAEENKAASSLENRLSLNNIKVNPQYVPKFQLQNVKNRKLKRFDDSFYNNIIKNQLINVNGVNTNDASSGENISGFPLNDHRKNGLVGIVKKSKINTTLERYSSNPKRGLIYVVNTAENNPSRVTSVQKYPLKMFITKEEHEKELLKLKKQYELECNSKPNRKGDDNKKPQKSKKKKKNDSNTDIVQTITDVLDTLYRYVEDTVTTTKVVEKRTSPFSPHLQKEKKNLRQSEEVTNLKIHHGSQKTSNEKDIATQLETPQGILLRFLNKTRSTLKPITNTQLQKKDLNSTLRRKVSKKRKITKRSISMTESPKLQYTQNNNFIPFNSSEADNLHKNHLTTHIHVTSEYSGEPAGSESSITGSRITPPTQPKTTPIPCKKSKQNIYYDDYYFDFDDFSYYDYPEEDEESEDINLSMESDEDQPQNIESRTKERIKNRHKRKIVKDYDFLGVFDYIYDFIKPIRRVIRKIMAGTTDLRFSTGYRKQKNPHNLVYDNKINTNNDISNYENSFGSWLWSWFNSEDENNKIEETPTTEDPSWIDSWFNTQGKATTPISDNGEGNGDWLFNWFDYKSKPNQQTSTTATTTTVPFLTISDPMKNPQKWIGILAQHIVNSTANPISPLNELNDIPQKITYDKYQIWRLKPNGEEQLRTLQDYQNSKEGSKLQWLQGPSLRGLTDVLIPQQFLYDFQGTLNFEEIDSEVLIFDVGKAILYENRKEYVNNSSKLQSFAMNWSEYYSYDDILRFVESIRINNPTIVDVIHIGRSYDGRPLVIIKLSLNQTKSPATKKKPKPKKKSKNMGVFIEAGIHGREWIGPASATWIINEILKIMKNNGTTNQEEEETIKKVTWYIMPVLNPDGYEYTREFDRMWCKSRSKHNANNMGIFNAAVNWFKSAEVTQKVCYGVDLDRNWDYKWSQQDKSKSPCNEFFPGPFVFSEPETKAVSKFLIDHRKQLKLFLSLHSYGQILSYPMKFNSSYSSQKLDDLTDIAMVGIDGLRKTGSSTRYKIDSNNDMIPPKFGTADYFATFEAGIPFSYTIHLGDNGIHGYLLPGSYIESTASDAFQIIKAMVEYIII